MTQNEKAIQQLLDEYKFEADQSAKQGIVDFSVLYA